MTLTPDQLQQLAETFRARPDLKEVYVYDEGAGWQWDAASAEAQATGEVVALSAQDVKDLLAGKTKKTVKREEPQ